jgi:hypothetical protein
MVVSHGDRRSSSSALNAACEGLFLPPREDQLLRQRVGVGDTGREYVDRQRFARPVRTKAGAVGDGGIGSIVGRGTPGGCHDAAGDMAAKRGSNDGGTGR